MKVLQVILLDELKCTLISHVATESVFDADAVPGTHIASAVGIVTVYVVPVISDPPVHTAYFGTTNLFELLVARSYPFSTT